MAMSVQSFDYFQQAFPRTDLVELIPDNARRILDVGCGVGKTGQILRERGFEEIFAVEINPDAAQQAESYYQKVIIGNIEEDILPFSRGFFDCILYGDVLEHLIDPWKVLRSHREILKDNGIIICSIPNIRYYKILKPLILNGRWEYVDLGILDRTHLRFFTLKTIEDMFRETGYEIKKLIKKKRCSKTMKLINRLVFNGLIDFLVLQYRIVGIKTSGIPNIEEGVGETTCGCK
jgi:2-polyprenyl-3-methyl-5-hydroxy-6-metoxy-1,4-benzoquinol methylase